MKNKKKSLKDTYEVLSDQELAILKASQEGEIDRSTLPPHDNSDMAQAKRYVKKNKLTFAFALLTALLLIAVIGVLIFMLIQTLAGKPSTDDFTVYLGDDEEYTLRYKDAVIDDVFYLDILKIAKYTDLKISGTEDSLKLTCEDKTYVRFETGKNTATVNGVRVRLGGEAKIIKATKDSETQCLVPFSFIEKLFSHPTVGGDTPGVRTVFNSKTNEVKIGRVLYQNGNPLPISFSPNPFDLAENDTLLYYKKLYPSIPSVCEKNTMLVNKNNPLGEGYTPKGLFSLNSLDCPIVKDGEYQLTEAAALSLTAMMDALEKAINKEDSVVVTSAYRSYNRQTILFDTYVTELMESKKYTQAQAEAEVSKTAARAGYSEHQSGLCVDLIEKGKLELDVSFENCEAFRWLCDNAHRYGFILRYPKNKTHITGYSYEPWHYRFVGVDAATVIYEDSICLEEYLAIT